MINKIGLNDYNFEIVEKELINKKINLIDELFTFNESKFSLNYLKKLNEYLFKDIYLDEDIGFRDLKKEEINEINKLIDLIVNICIFKPNDINNILKLINKIWKIQPFLIGNTRTLLALLKVLSSAFMLEIYIDTDKDIMSKPGVFKMGEIVNYKRLTKHN